MVTCEEELDTANQLVVGMSRQIEACRENIGDMQDAHASDAVYTFGFALFFGLAIGATIMFLYNDWVASRAAVAKFKADKGQRNAKWSVFMRASDLSGTVQRVHAYACAAPRCDLYRAGVRNTAAARRALACDDVVEMDDGIWGDYAPGCRVVLKKFEQQPCIYTHHRCNYALSCEGRKYACKDRVCVVAGDDDIPNIVPARRHGVAVPIAMGDMWSFINYENKCTTIPVDIVHDPNASAAAAAAPADDATCLTPAAAEACGVFSDDKTAVAATAVQRSSPLTME